MIDGTARWVCGELSGNTFFLIICLAPTTLFFLNNYMAKPKVNCSMADVELILRTCTVHADFKNDFGIFCAGMASFITCAFDKYKNEKRYAKVNVDYKLMAITTIALMDSYEQARQSLGHADIIGNDNEMVRRKLMMIVEQAKKEGKKES